MLFFQQQQKLDGLLHFKPHLWIYLNKPGLISITHIKRTFVRVVSKVKVRESQTKQLVRSGGRERAPA